MGRLEWSDVRQRQRTYDHAIRDFVAWYCSEPRLAFNRTVVLRYRVYLELQGYAPTTINPRLAAVRRIAYEAADAGLLSHEIQFLLWHVSIQTERYLGCKRKLGIAVNGHMGIEPWA